MFVGGRSRNLDLENQITMFTENSCVQQALTKVGVINDFSLMRI